MANVGENQVQAVAAAQRIAFVRAAIIAAVIAMLAPVLARIFGIPGQEANIQWLGLVTLIKSLKNWRAIQVQAEARYGPQTITNLGSNTAAVIAAALAAVWFRDARAMLVSLFAEAIVYVLLSYVSIARYRIVSLDMQMLKAALRYGLPLAANGFALLLLSQLDRIIVANILGLKTLALYALVWSLAIAPTAPLSYAIGSLSWPLLKRQYKNPSEMSYTCLGILLGYVIVAASYAICIGTLLDILVPLVFGSQYNVTSGVQATAAGTAFLRIFRTSPNVILLVQGMTGRLTLGNTAAVVGPLIGLGLAMWTLRLDAVMLGIIIGDLVSLILLLALIWDKLPRGAFLKHMLLLTLPVCLAAIVPYYSESFDWRVRIALLLMGAIVILWETMVLYQEYFRDFLPTFLPPKASSLTPQASANIGSS
jgi:O-antigen/teichoic acid export membrane protein